MKTKTWKLSILLFLLIGIARQGSVYAGIIPYSLIESEDQAAKRDKCQNLENQHYETLKKIASLKREDRKYLAELHEAEKNQCK